MADSFDLIVVGAGPGGYVAALRAAQLGLKTAVVEKDKTLGGTCLNVGCIPSKALLDSSEHFAFAQKKLGRHGVTVQDVGLDLLTMMKRKDEVVRGLTSGIAGLFRKRKIEHIQGWGTLKGPGAVDVKMADGQARTLSAKNIILASGSAPASLKGVEFDGRRIVSSTEALSFSEVPGKLLVIGGGAIGLEMGSVWSRLGSKVTVVEYFDRIVPAADKQATSELQKILTRQGLEFKLSTKVTSAKVSGKKVQVEMESGDKKETLEADYVLVAVGRRAYSEGLGLADAGVAVDKAGRVEVNEHFETNVKGVYAIGDLIRGPMLAHKAEDEGVAVAEVISGQHGHVNYEAIPSVVYTWPELASVGVSEEDCKAKGLQYKTGMFPFMANGRAKAMGETEGFVKVIADAATDRVLGVTIVGPRASDMIASAVMVMEFGGAAEDVARSSAAHPTLAEVFKEAALAVDKRALHI